MNRLRLAGLDITILSGPVSMYYLKPSRSSMPLALLFGDYHDGLEGMARQCDSDDGCYTIYSDEFLLALDQLAERYAVDFYLEYSRDDNLDPNQVLFGQLKYKIHGCGDTETRASLEYEEKCLTRNIRHHRTDVRRFRGSPESYLDLFYGQAALPELDDNIPSPYLLPIVRQCLQDTFRVLHQAAVEKKSYQEVQDQVSRAMYQLVLTENSLCGKQIRKVPYDIRWERIFTIIGQKELQHFSEYLDIYSMPHHQRELDKILDAMLGGESFRIRHPRHIKMFWYIQTIILYLNAAYLDLYTVARMLKPSLQSDLSLGMFGNAHTVKIAWFLQEEVGYTLEYSVPASEDTIRNVQILQRVDIDQDLLERQVSESYLIQLVRERRQRVLEEEKNLVPWALERYRAIAPPVRRLYGIRPGKKTLSVYDEVIENMVDSFLHKKVLSLAQLIEIQVPYVEECALELVNFIAKEVCKTLVDRDSLPLMCHAAIIASVKREYPDIKIYQVMAPLVDDYRENKLRLIDMVTDIEVRTNFQLCEKTISINNK